MGDVMDIKFFSLPNCLDSDFQEHNAESSELWKAFAANCHERIPVRLNTNPRILMLDPAYNHRGLDYETYMNDADTMGQAVLEWLYWTRFLLPGDQEKGLPESWKLAIDFENLYDAAWFGCPVHYRAGQVPDTLPILDDDHKRMLFDRGAPEPFAGEWAEKCLAMLEVFHEKCTDGWTFLGQPVVPPDNVPFAGNDGVFTVAANLRGATNLCLDMLADPEYVHELLGYITEAFVARMMAWRERLGMPAVLEEAGIADDCIELLSTDQYREFVLPYHKRIFEAFGSSGKRSIHLCGDAQRHFRIVKDELGVTSFDTGFPVDFGQFRRDLGPDVLISGGPHISFFLKDDPAPIQQEVRRILTSGVLEGGRVILQEGNNLPPRARLDVCEAFYAEGKRLGRV